MKHTSDRAEAKPTKQFFVSMLTRDISLDDAILDLLDNCLDGALRLAGEEDVNYSKHFVKITMTKERFAIEDNCGGIPREVAKNYAFKMGRDHDDDRDSDSETIGMYGVGMKRAIFKMGKDALVRTRHGDDTYEVPITSHWLEAKDWDPLPINEPTEASEMLADAGTTIVVKDLYEGVARHFDNDAFGNKVRTAISEHFTMFLQRGLVVILNNEHVKPVRVEVLVSTREDGPAPFVFRKTIEGVVVSITVGRNLNRGLGDDADNEAVGEGTHSSATAGWTVLCNDRAVIVGDKSRLTGWGDSIPLYHPQFDIITGVIEFRSKRADKLPVTTTKRALDTSSNVWLESLVKMKDGMRVWIDYTNQWKNQANSEQEQARHWQDARPMPIAEAIEAVAVRKAARKADDDSLEFNPKKNRVMPEPPNKTPSSRRVTFMKPAEAIRVVARALLDDENAKPGAVGEKCFDLTLAKVKSMGS